LIVCVNYYNTENIEKISDSVVYSYKVLIPSHIRTADYGVK